MDCAQRGARRCSRLTFNPASVHTDTVTVIMSPSKLIFSVNEAKLFVSHTAAVAALQANDLTEEKVAAF